MQLIGTLRILATSRLRSADSAIRPTTCWIGAKSAANYSNRIKRSAARVLRSVDKSDRVRLTAAIDRLAASPRLGKALKGRLRGLRRVRVGGFRVLYEVRNEQLIILAVRVAHQRNAYRRLLAEAPSNGGSQRVSRGVVA